MSWHGNSQNYLFMSQTKTNKKLAESFIQLKHFGDDHNYQTRAKPTKLLDIPHSVPITMELTLLNITA